MSDGGAVDPLRVQTGQVDPVQTVQKAQTQQQSTPGQPNPVDPTQPGQKTGQSDFKPVRAVSFAQILKGSTRGTGPHTKVQKSFFDGPKGSAPLQIVADKTPSTFKGRRAITFCKSEIAKLASPFAFTLVGKFSHGLPPKLELHKSIEKLGLKGEFKLGYLDKKHIYIHLDLEEDFSRLWLRGTWRFEGFPCRMFKWSPKFRADVESPLVPVWISLPKLPIHLFHYEALKQIASLIGKPLRIDEPTATLSRPSCARVCIELDLFDEMPSEVWIGVDEESDDGFFQDIVYENVPQYCINCHHLGHEQEACLLLAPPSAVVNEKTNHVEAYQGGDLRKLLEKKRGKKPIVEEERTTNEAPAKVTILIGEPSHKAVSTQVEKTPLQTPTKSMSSQKKEKQASNASRSKEEKARQPTTPPGQPIPTPDQLAPSLGQTTLPAGQPASTPEHLAPSPGQHAPSPGQPTLPSGQPVPTPCQPILALVPTNFGQPCFTNSDVNSMSEYQPDSEDETHNFHDPELDRDEVLKQDFTLQVHRRIQTRQETRRLLQRNPSPPPSKSVNQEEEEEEEEEGEFEVVRPRRRKSFGEESSFESTSTKSKRGFKVGKKEKRQFPI